MSFTDIEDKSQDEIDAVINRLAGNNSSLAACSLVSKRWYARCRQQGFRRAKLAELDGLRYSDWFPREDGAIRDGSQHGELWVSSTTLYHHDHFKSSSGITSLTLNHISFTLLNFPNLHHSFCNLIPTLRSLRLLCPTACPHALFRFISMFCNLQDTEIHSPSWDKPSNAPIESSDQHRGELCISEFNDGSFPFLSLLQSQATNYEGLTIRKCSFDDARPLQRFISATGRNMRRIQIVVAGHGKVPFISLQDCPALEQICISDIKPNVSFHRISSIVSSVTSSRFQKLILKLQTTGRMESDATQIDLTDGISYLDAPLSHLARVASEGNRKVSLVLLGQEPEFLAQGLIDFHALGYIWAGEEIGGGEYSWTLTAPKNGRVKRCRIRILLDKLLGRNNLDQTSMII